MGMAAEICGENGAPPVAARMAWLNLMLGCTSCDRDSLSVECWLLWPRPCLTGGAAAPLQAPHRACAAHLERDGASSAAGHYRRCMHHPSSSYTMYLWKSTKKQYTALALGDPLSASSRWCACWHCPAYTHTTPYIHFVLARPARAGRCQLIVCWHLALAWRTCAPGLIARGLECPCLEYRTIMAGYVAYLCSLHDSQLHVAGAR